MSSRIESTLVVLTSATVLFTLGAGQLRAQNQAYFYLERSQIFYSFGNETIFEAQLAAQLIVHQTMPELFAGFTREGWRGGWSFSASPMVRLRMSRERSMPILPASFMPHFVYQYSWLKNRSKSTNELERAAADLDMFTLQARLSHHSNGEDGCLYTTQALEDDDCVFQNDAGPDAEAVNFEDGSFSTNFLRLGGFYRRLVPDAQANYIRRSFYAGAEVEFHTGPILDSAPGAISDDQRRLYGNWRQHLRAGGALAVAGDGGNGLFIDLHFMHASNTGTGVTSWAFESEAYLIFQRFGGWGLYARVQSGQDPYNLAFVNDPTRLHLGLAWIQDRFASLSLNPL